MKGRSRKLFNRIIVLPFRILQRKEGWRQNPVEIWCWSRNIPQRGRLLSVKLISCTLLPRTGSHDPLVWLTGMKRLFG